MTLITVHVGAFEYKDGTLALSGPGQTSTQSPPQYYYYTKDHLGNIRSVVTKNPSTNAVIEVQRTHYYPYGGIIADISTGRNVQPRLYNILSSTGAVCCDPTDIVWRRSAHEKAERGNGKELDRTNNLFWYDFLACPYDPTRDQFTGPDQKAEEYYPWNPFTFCLNNPMKYFDSDGNSPISIFAKFAAKQGVKQTARATVKKVITQRLKAYTSKKWASQLMNDALTSLDVAMGESWWGYALEVVPVAGDLYGGYKLT